MGVVYQEARCVSALSACFSWSVKFVKFKVCVCVCVYVCVFVYVCVVTYDDIESNSKCCCLSMFVDNSRAIVSEVQRNPLLLLGYYHPV